MLMPEENELLTRVGPRTCMGNLLRRYWPHHAASLAYGVPADDGFVSHIRRQMSNFSPIAEELIEDFTKHRGRASAREPAPAAE